MKLEYGIKIESNLDKVESELKEAIEKALYVMGVNAVEGATDAISGKYSIESAVDTGRLRASISFITPTQKGDNGKDVPNSGVDDKLYGKAEENSVVVGSNVEYAEYVHNGTSRMDGRPFLREGIDQVKDKMQEQVTKVFKGEL